MRLKLFIAAWRSWFIRSSLQMYVCFGGSPGVNVSNFGRAQWTAHSVHSRRRNIHKSCAVHYHTGGPRVTPILWSNGHQSCIGLAMAYFLRSRVENAHCVYLFFKLSGHQTLNYHHTRSMPILVIVGGSYQRWITNQFRAFAISSPTAWNCLPVDLRNPGHSLLTFRRKLKTHLFNLSFF